MYFLLAALTSKPTDFLKDDANLRDPARNLLSSHAAILLAVAATLKIRREEN